MTLSDIFPRYIFEDRLKLVPPHVSRCSGLIYRIERYNYIYRYIYTDRLFIYFLCDLSFMVRNTGCENSDGCSAAVLERMVVDPGPKRKDTGEGTLLHWFDREEDHECLPPETGPKSVSGESGTYPSFQVGGWKFTVKTWDLHLIGDLKNYIEDISHFPRADVKFTSRLVRCTEQGRLGGWAWQKERVQISS
ncbi:MAG: hypothetical protein ABSD81_01500 [Methanomicrobiales archaeon]|jgi:hypothetical protein